MIRTVLHRSVRNKCMWSSFIKPPLSMQITWTHSRLEWGVFSFSYVRQKLPGVYHLSSWLGSWSCETFCTGTVIERHAGKAGLKEQPDGELAIPEWQNAAHSCKENALHGFLRHNLITLLWVLCQSPQSHPAFHSSTVSLVSLSSCSSCLWQYIS